MPKNTSSAGARSGKNNFDPRYSDRAKASKKSGIGRSHRGYQAPSDEAPAKKRWTAEDRAGRDQAREITGRGERSTRGDMRDDFAPRSERRSFDRSDDRGGRPARSFDRNDRPARSFDRNDRPARSFDRDDRGQRSFSRDDRSARSFDRNDRPARSFDRNDRPARSFDHKDRPARSFDRNDRPARSFDGERPARSFDRNDRNDRPARSFDRNDRPARSFDRNDRPARSFDGERPARSFDRNDRPARSFDGERPARSFDRNDRPARSFDRNDRPARSFDRNDRPARSFDRNDRPARSFDRNERPARSFDGERPARSFDRDARAVENGRKDRPQRSFHDERPKSAGTRSDWNATDKGAKFADHEDVVLERLNANAISAGDVENATFDGLGLGQNIVRVLAELGAEKPFPIQAATIPVILEGRDTLGRGRTGSGKTIAFGAPLVEAILRSKEGVKREFGRAPSAIILAPTRELALQIDRTVQPIARSVGLFTTQIYGGVPQARQVGALKKGVDIVIGTPGRIEDLINQGKLDLSEAHFAVLDEADHMCELGFLEPVQRILRETADGSQKLLFSATLDTEVEALVNEFLVNPAVYEVAGEDQDSGTIDHHMLVIDHRDKPEILNSLVDRDGKTLVFTRTRAYAEMLAEQFEDVGISAVALHGDLNQAKRTRNLEKMAKGRANVLVATDVAARGIHVDDIDLVIQADPPMEYKTYLHRAGRTGRAGNAGTVVTMVSRGSKRRVDDLMRRAEIEASVAEARPGDEILDELAGRALTLDEVTA